MHWKDEGYLLSKNNFEENSIIIDVFTLYHGKYTGIVYGGSSRKQKKIFQIGNKISLSWKSKSEGKIGYFSVELIRAISPAFFEDKKKSICIFTASSILKILLPDRQINKKIYLSFEKMINQLNLESWIKLYVLWELSLIKELGFDINLNSYHNLMENKQSIEINNKTYKIPNLLLLNDNNFTNRDIRESLIFNKNLLMENFIIPNNLQLPFSRNLLEKYYL